MNSLFPCPKTNYHNKMPKATIYPTANRNQILTLTLKPSLNPQKIIWRCEDQQK